MLDELVALVGSSVVIIGLGLCSSCGHRETATAGDDAWERERREMVELLRIYGIGDERLLAVMGGIPRHLFVPESFRRFRSPYGDHPCPIGEGQTISQPYIVAYMTEKLEIEPGDKILEVGTGSGYQAAVLAGMGARVYSIEILPALAARARTILDLLGYANQIHVRHGDGYQGWPEEAPFDAVIVTCAPEAVPEALVNQLAEGGIMLLPTGVWMSQRLVLLHKIGGRIIETDDLPVRFVPMIKSPR